MPSRKRESEAAIALKKQIFDSQKAIDLLLMSSNINSGTVVDEEENGDNFLKENEEENFPRSISILSNSTSTSTIGKEFIRNG
jgi:hypothetical protein